MMTNIPEPGLFEPAGRYEHIEDARRYIFAIDFTHLKQKMAGTDAQGLGWTQDHLDFTEVTYKHWLFLRRKYEHLSMPPSDDIDRFWHYHMLDTRAYLRDCQSIFGYYLHHFPYMGTRGASDESALAAEWEKVQELHTLEFGEGIYEYDPDYEDEDEDGAGEPQGVSNSVTSSLPLPVFLHISKAAGHTTRAIMHQNYTGEYIDNIVRGRLSVNGRVRVPTSNDSEVALFIAEVMARQNNLDFVATTLPFGIHKFLHRPVQYFSFVREPVSRCISYWYFAHRERDHHPAWANFERQSFDLGKILAGTSNLQLVNHQVRLLSGSSDVVMTPTHLALAKDRIKTDFLLVGATERYDDCLEVLAKAFGWPRTDYERRHVGDKSNAALLPQGAAGAFAEANKLDAELHEWVIEDYLPSRLASEAPVPALAGDTRGA